MITHPVGSHRDIVDAMSRGDAGARLRRLLCAAVVLGVIAMHHLGSPSHAGGECAHPHTPATSTAAAHAAGHPHPASSPAHSAADAHGGGAGVVAATPTTVSVQQAGCAAGHGMFHHCLAIMAALLLLAAHLALRRVDGSVSWRSATRANSGTTARAPPWTSGRGILSSACVLRI